MPLPQRIRCSHCRGPLDACAAGCPWKDAGCGRPTTRQRQVLDFVLESIERKGYAPTLREICRAIRITSTNGASDHINALCDKGYLRRKPGTARALVPLNPSGQMQEIERNDEALPETLWWYRGQPGAPGLYLYRGLLVNEIRVNFARWSSGRWEDEDLSPRENKRLVVFQWAEVPQGPER